MTDQLAELYRRYEKLWDQVADSGSPQAARALEALAEEIAELEARQEREAA
jgi:hypothetical protein